jgi:protein-tyrosine phosphatase
MFVCWGNICRSPMAEFIMKKMVEDRSLENSFFIESSAISREEIRHGHGNAVHIEAQRILKKHKISCEGKRAVQLTKDDYNNFDYFIGMDRANIRNMNIILGGDHLGKIYKMMSFAGSGDDVADPWYSGDFTTTYNDILSGCIGLLDYLKNNLE